MKPATKTARFDTGAANPPRARKRPVASVHHGVERIDNYGWLRAENWQEAMRDPARLAPEIRAHLEAENAYQTALMADTAALQKRIVAEMRGRVKEDDSSVPMRDGPWAYGVRYVEGGEQPVFVRIPSEGGPEQVLLDGDAQSVGKPYFRLGGAGHSPDHCLISWSFDDKGSEYFTTRFRDLSTGRDLPDNVADTSGGVFTKDSRAYPTRRQPPAVEAAAAPHRQHRARYPAA